MQKMLGSLLVGLPFLLLASKAVISGGVIVEASNVTNVEVTASGWDLRPAADGGCGVGGCDPRLTRDGQNNNVSDSRWSCAKYVSGENAYCDITFTFDAVFDISHLILFNYITSDLTVPGTPLGEGQQVDLSAGESDSKIALDFELTNDQWVHLSEVEIFLIVDNLNSIVVSPAPNRSYVDARTVANVYAYASNWDLSGDAGCGEAGCDPRLASDGENNTVAASRWSCSLAADTDDSNFITNWEPTRCNLALQFDVELTISHLIVYMHESDDATKTPMSMIVTSASCSMENGCFSNYDTETTFETVPGTPLGEGQRIYLARPSLDAIAIHPNISLEGQSVGISEVEVFVEVTQTDVKIAAAEAWNTVTAQTATTVTPSATGSIDGFAPGKVTDGYNNTVVTSYWSCNLNVVELSTLTQGDFCGLSLELGDDYALSYIVLYVHDSDDATKDPIDFTVYNCMVDNTYCSDDDEIGAYSTKPGTALGEGERFNLIRPYTNEIGIKFNITGHETIDISEVELFLDVPDGTPTPSPFAGVSTTTGSAYYSWWDDDDSLATPTIDYGVGNSLAPPSTMPPEISTEWPSDSGSLITTTTADEDDGSGSTTASTLPPEILNLTSNSDSLTTTTMDEDSGSSSTTNPTLSPEIVTDSHSGAKRATHVARVVTAMGVSTSLFVALRSTIKL